MNNIYLCGFMGCGKSRNGREIAKRMGMPFEDTDYVIVQGECRSIPEIFDRYGEEGFRRLETAYIAALAKKYKNTAAVIATGGGAVLNAVNRGILKQSGYTFFINTPFEVCYKRIYQDPNRPVAYNSTKAGLRQRYLNRLPAYKQAADFTVNGDENENPDYVAEEIAALYKVVVR
jgi:shikimate kinase